MPRYDSEYLKGTAFVHWIITKDDIELIKSNNLKYDSSLLKEGDKIDITYNNELRNLFGLEDCHFIKNV